MSTMIEASRNSFLADIDADPLDASNRLVFADWCEENGNAEEAERQRLLGRLVGIISPRSKEKLLASIAKANGRRRARIISLGEVLAIVREAEKTGWAADNAGTVGNSYEFPASTTVVLAIRKADETIAVDVVEAPAKATTPGRAWKELQPWRPATAACKEKMMQWANER